MSACPHGTGVVYGVASDTRVTSDAAAEVARVMAGLGTASRVQILGRLREGASSVGELCASVGMAQPAVSQQLRICGVSVSRSAFAPAGRRFTG